MKSRKCITCHEKYAAWGYRPFCRTCAPHKEPRYATYGHRVQAVDQFVTPPVIPVVPAVEQRTITVQGIEYVVMADGFGAWQTEPRNTPRNLGCSLLDISRIVK